MEVKITDNRGKNLDHEIRGNVICLDINKMYLDTGYCLNFPLKRIIEAASLIKLSQNHFIIKKLSNDIVTCVNKRKEDSIVIFGIIISLGTQFYSPTKYYTYAYLDSGYLIFMEYFETDLNEMIEITKIENN